MLPILNMDSTRAGHMAAAAAAAAVVVLIVAATGAKSVLPAAAVTVWALYCVGASAFASDPPINGNLLRQMATGAAFALALGGGEIAVAIDVVAAVGNMASEVTVGSKVSLGFSGIAVAAGVWSAVRQGLPAVWLSTGRLLVAAGTALRNHKVKAIPGSGFTDPSRPIRTVANEYMLLLITTSAVGGGAAIIAVPQPWMWITMAVSTAFAVLITAFTVDKALTKNPTTRAEQIASSLLSVSEGN